MSLELNPVFEGSGLQLGTVFDVAGVPTLGTVTPGDTSVTFTWSGPATHYRLTPLDTGVPGSAVSIPPSPATVTGLDANREYRVEIGPNATTWTDFEDFGTNNPGTGGGEFTTPTAIAGAVAAAEASGLQASISTGTSIAAGVGSASAAGLQAAIALRTVVAAGVGAATAQGITAAINLGSNVTIAAGVGAAAASGLPAAVVTSTGIAAGVGQAAALGVQAGITIASGVTIAGGVGLAQASGQPATITLAGPLVISAGVGAADALGLRAVVRALGSLPAFLEQPTTGASWSYKQTATLWRLVSRDEWGGQVTHELAGLFLCDYAIDDRQANTARGSEYVTRLMVYTSLPGVRRGDMLKIGATNEADPYKAGAHEVLESTAFADTFRAEGAPDFRIVT